jgi:hypothetical protein
MSVYLYFSLTPEALIASMLPPEEFGHYYAVGRMLKIRGQAMFFEVDSAFRHDFFPIDEGVRRCTPHEDGGPKASVYISTYRVLEHLPLSALGDLHLATAFGQVLSLEAAPSVPDQSDRFYLYQELVPVSSLVASLLPPKPFYESITTNPLKLVRFPAMCFVELMLGELSRNPERGNIGDLPYPYINHLRECLLELDPQTKQSKMVNRLQTAEFAYRTVDSGFYIGNSTDLRYYPMPSQDVLRRDHRLWWRSANRVD